MPPPRKEKQTENLLQQQLVFTHEADEAVSITETAQAPEPALPEVYTVSELTMHLEEVLENDSILGFSVTVQGELSNVKRSSRGHMYFTVKDGHAAIGGILWASTARRLKFDPEDGQEVFLTGKLQIYRPNGSYSIVGSKLEPVGVGALQLAFLQLKEKLEAEGLFLPDYKQPIPEFPARIGLVTSNTGAVVHDMLRTIRAKNPLVDVLLCPVKVQGEGAAEDIAQGIRELNDPSYNLDTIIIGRGGGSFEDLFCFSEESVVRTVFNSRVPIIAGVGHEPDYSLADAAADYSAATPTAAAEYAVPDIHALRENYRYQARELLHRMSEQLLDWEQHLDHTATRFVEYFHGYLDAAASTLDQQEERLKNGFEFYFQKRENHLARLASELEAFSPLKTLGRGYSIATDASGKVIRETVQVKAGDRVTVRLSDGRIMTEVVSMEEENDG